MRFALSLSVLLTCGGVAPASADDVRPRLSQSDAATDAYLSMMVPRMCLDYEFNDTSYFGWALVNDLKYRDLFSYNAFGPGNISALAAFQNQFTVNPERACNDLWQKLGPDGFGLLRLRKY